MRIKLLFKGILYVGIIVNSQFATNLELYKVNYHNPNSYIFRRVRGIGTKEELVISHFIEGLRAKFGTGILETYLIPKELREEEERIDIIITYDGIEREELLHTATSITYQICGRYDKVIIPIAISKRILHSTSLEEIFKFIKYPEFDLRDPKEESALNYYGNGDVILSLAEIAYERYEQTRETKYLYGAFYNVFRACEEFISGVVVYSGQQLGDSHGRVLNQFYHLPDKLVSKGKRKQWKALKRKIWDLMSNALNIRMTYFYSGRKYTHEDAKLIKDMLKTTGMLKKFIRENIFS